MTRETNLRGPIFTPGELHRLGGRLKRRMGGVNSALSAICGGESLHLQYRAGSPLWSLSCGRCVSAKVAEILIKRPSVVPVRDALFSDHSQTWRYKNG